MRTFWDPSCKAPGLLLWAGSLHSLVFQSTQSSSSIVLQKTNWRVSGTWSLQAASAHITCWSRHSASRSVNPTATSDRWLYDIWAVPKPLCPSHLERKSSFKDSKCPSPQRGLCPAPPCWLERTGSQVTEPDLAHTNAARCFTFVKLCSGSVFLSLSKPQISRPEPSCNSFARLDD